MKIYTQTYDLSKASLHRFWVAPYSDFKIGIKLLEKGELSDKDFTLKAGSTEFTPDEDKVDNYTLFTTKSNGTGFVEYTIEVEGVAEKLKLMQIVTDSTVFEIDASGGDVPADVATQSWVNSQISDFITDDELTGYATKDELTGYVETGDLTAYATKDELTAYAEESELTAYATKDELTGYVENGDLTAYYTKSETSSATELADAFAGAGGGGAISAFDLSESPVWSKTMVENAAANNICLPQTICVKRDGSISAYNLTSFENLTATIGQDNVKIIVGTQISSLNSSNPDNQYLNEYILPDTLKHIGDLVFSGSYHLSSTIKIPDSVSSCGANAFFNTDVNIDFGNTRTNIVIAGNNDYVRVYARANVKFYVPDNLYDTWISNVRWSTVASQIHRHSELEAPYLYSSKVTGGAETGTTGTPAAVNAVKSVYETDWQTLSASADANTFYVVLPDPA